LFHRDRHDKGQGTSQDMLYAVTHAGRNTNLQDLCVTRSTHMGYMQRGACCDLRCTDQHPMP
jgi:hypothetical protein